MWHRTEVLFTLLSFTFTGVLIHFRRTFPQRTPSTLLKCNNLGFIINAEKWYFLDIRFKCIFFFFCRGDYRSGKRLNMRKVIPYIASQFRKDKIWLRRTKPSKRQYQIMLAVDDSSSMNDNHSKQVKRE